MPLQDLNQLSLDELYGLLTRDNLDRRLFELARDEDLGTGRDSGDITSLACIDEQAMSKAYVVCREPIVACGLRCVNRLMETFGLELQRCDFHEDGQHVCSDEVLFSLEGPLRGILALERTLLNLLSRLCGVATLTAEYLALLNDECHDCRARLFDTRKTTPGWRALEKYAVRCGGGMCHRIALHDAVLIKDNHLAAVPRAELAQFIVNAAEKARSDREIRFLEIECDTLDQVQQLLRLKRGMVDVILLDNMSLEQLREAVMLRDAMNDEIQLEASGGVNKATVGAIAQTGVDRISVGALTHQAVSCDLAMDIPHRDG